MAEKRPVGRPRKARPEESAGAAEAIVEPTTEPAPPPKIDIDPPAPATAEVRVPFRIEHGGSLPAVIKEEPWPAHALAFAAHASPPPVECEAEEVAVRQLSELNEALSARAAAGWRVAFVCPPVVRNVRVVENEAAVPKTVYTVFWERPASRRVG